MVYSSRQRSSLGHSSENGTGKHGGKLHLRILAKKKSEEFRNVVGIASCRLSR